MPAKWQKVNITIPDHLGPDEREAVAAEVLDFIRERTQKKNKDKNNKDLPAYSKEYVKSLDFKIAGKSKGNVNLTLSGDMLGAMGLLSHKRGKITIGFENGTPENARADGNIRGTYGQSKPVAPPRDFLGIAPEDLQKILKQYPNDPRARSRADQVLNVTKKQSEDDDEED